MRLNIFFSVKYALHLSFSASLARAFGSAKNMLSASLDCKETLMDKHPTAKENLEELEKLGCTILNEVACHTMTNHPSLEDMKFDRIIFNFPHAGYHYLYGRESEQGQIELHQEVVKGFLSSARDMLTSKGEVHVTHKTSYPFYLWEVEKLAEEVGLNLTEEVEFELLDYPGYENKRGDKGSSNDSFPVGRCSTFKFKLPIHT
ncbi:uncharacterized protein At4g26485-like [Macadamia integrifolia]|uniref:uncharacterized protein At4g26485-like n=1 Tax=Macadamia integrifolia TaxID=60698 RepID=UPI001C4ECACD|nr:uncharacterized protein At4g26485-like [Macadamia integrifolia]